MDAATDLDRIRAWVEGRLPPAEVERLERELAADPQLAELCERFRDVHAWTAVEERIPPCDLTFEDLERRLDAERTSAAWPRRAAAAALLLLGGAALAVLLRAGAGGDADGERGVVGPDAEEAPSAPERARVALRAIELAPPAERKPAAPFPELLADFDPRGEDGVRWLDDMATAFFVARAARRPLLVFGTLPECPWCAELRADVLAAPAVVDLVDRYVPFEWDLSALDGKQGEQIRLMRGYPLLEVWTADDELVLNFSGRPGVERFEEMMHQGLERAGATGEVPDWAEVRALARRFLAAREALRAGRLAEAQAALRALARADDGGPIAEVCAAQLRELADAARAALLEARERAASDPAKARAELEEGARRFEGTGFEGDLRAVLEAWDEGRPFPELAQARGA